MKANLKIACQKLCQNLIYSRVEECLDSGEACPLIPHGPRHYESKCVQKFTYQRMLVYDPYDKYLPFAVEGRCSVELMSACRCRCNSLNSLPL